jgi:iron complex outermembrane recepter protein
MTCHDARPPPAIVTSCAPFVAQRFEPPKSSGPLPLHSDSHNISWDGSASYALDGDTNLFARVATGYRAPSMQGRLNGLSDKPSMAGAEKALSYEAGIKADMLDRRARLSATVFQYRVKDKQLTAGSGTINMNQLINANKVTGQGVEMDFQAILSDDWRASLGASYNDTEIKDANLFVQTCGNQPNTNGVNGCTPSGVPGPLPYTQKLNGLPLPRSPKWQTNFTLRYSHPLADGELYALTDWSYRTEYNMFLYEAKEYKAKALLEGGLCVGYKWDNGKYEVAAFARNITNRIQVVAAIDFDNLTGIVNEPRNFGAQFRVNFEARRPCDAGGSAGSCPPLPPVNPPLARIRPRRPSSRRPGPAPGSRRPARCAPRWRRRSGGRSWHPLFPAAPRCG